MQRPDVNGYVNITWPSKSIPHGGIFHTRTVKSSVEQQNFLKVLLEESKLNIALRQKNYHGLRQEETNKKSTKIRIDIPLIRPRTSRRRSLSAIRESEAQNVEVYLPPKRGEDREKLKEKLANIMTYGDVGQKPPAVPHVVKQNPKLPSKKEQWNDLVTQIRERAEWLADMEVLGHAGPHREVINDQIAERMRALDALGVDSRCSTARSTGSGFSVVPSGSSRSRRSYTSSCLEDSSKQQGKQKSKRILKQSLKNEENVYAYEKFSPLQYSPRRRV